MVQRFASLGELYSDMYKKKPQGGGNLTLSLRNFVFNILTRFLAYVYYYDTNTAFM